MPRSLAKRAWYESLKCVCRTAFVAGWRIRVEGRELVPAEGGGLVLSNHQSHLDPIILGVSCDRRLNYVVRDTLFGFAPFRWLINSLDAIPIDREGMGLSGLKETLKRLKRGELVLLFPEGTRTPDGEVHPIKPGFGAVAHRAEAPIIPVAIDGAFASWPRHQKFPRFGTIEVVYGQPLWPSEMAALSDDQLVAEVARRIRACHAQARAARERALDGRNAQPTSKTA